MPFHDGLREWPGEFDHNPAVIYAMDATFHLIHTNAAWNQFALENDAPELAGYQAWGTPVMNIIPRELRPFYSERFLQVLSNHKEISHLFECSSPLSFRQIHMRIVPFGDQGILTINSIVKEESLHEPAEKQPFDYFGAGGIVTVCSHCRRVKNAANGTTWDWAPSLWSYTPLKIANGMCPACLAGHYPAHRAPLNSVLPPATGQMYRLNSAHH